MTRAIILAAGLGTRLRPLTNVTPKALVEVGGEPLIFHHLKRLAAAGVRDVVINLHHLGDAIRTAVGSGRRFGVRVEYSPEAELLETGGAIRQALPTLGEQPFLCLSVDVWSEIDLVHLARPLPAPFLARLPLVRSSLGHDFGFAEVPPPGIAAPLVPEPATRFTFASVSLLHPALFKDSPRGHFPLRDLLFPALRAGLLTGELFEGTWFNIGRQEDLEAANAAAAGPSRPDAPGIAPPR